MKAKKKELDVDFIGGVGPLTKDEEKRISEVIRMFNSKKRATGRPARKLTTKNKVTA